MIKDHDPIENWSELANLVACHFKQGWIYRGVREIKEEDNLRPRIGRPNLRKTVHGEALPYDLGEEVKLLKRFQQEARSNFEFTPNTQLEWMILGQHHLLPTRLLDWSGSLLIAAFFAVENPLSPSPAIYAIEPPPELDDLTISPFKLKGNRPYLVRPPHISSRITSQKSVMTLHPEPTETWNPDGMHRWPISKSNTFSFTLKGILDFCGIHEASLFPDSADRHTSHLKWLHKWERLP